MCDNHAMRDDLRLLVACLPLLVACQAPPADLRAPHAEQEWNAWQDRPDVVEEPLTLDKAVELALANNLELTLSELQREIQHEASTAARRGMLPNLLANGQFESINKRRIARSQSATTGEESLEESFSSDKDTFTGTLEVAWSLLDFGLSYYRARQAHNQGQILDQQLRRTRQRITFDVTSAYYRAVVARSAVADVSQLLERLRKRQAVIAEQVRTRTISELDGLKYEDALATIQIRLHGFRSELRQARLQLTTLLGLAPTAKLTFSDVDLDNAPEAVPLDLEALGRESLLKRPELAEQDFHELIAADEVHARLITMFPNLSGFVGAEGDSNSFLRHNTWLKAGARVSWDLLRIPQQLAQYRQAQLSEGLVKERRMMTAMGVLTQLHLAAMTYQSARESHSLAVNQANVRSRLLAATRKAEASGQTDAGAVLEAEANALFSRIQARIAFAELQTAEARIDNTVGR